MTQKKLEKMDLSTKKLLTWMVPLIIISFLAGYMLHSPKSSDAEEHVHSENAKADTIWTCSMHPQIRKKEKGLCPICGMDLIPASAGDDNSGPWELTLSEKAQKLASIQEVEVKRRYVAHEVRVVGKVAPNEQLIGNLTARFPGRIDRLYVDFSGTAVRKGDHLVSIYSPQLVSAQKELLEAIRSQKNGPASLRKAATARVAASREKLRLWELTPKQIQDIEKRGKTVDHITIYSPMKGIVLKKHAVEGDYIKTGKSIYTISDLSKVWVKLDIYESDLKWVRLGQEVSFSVEAYPGETFSGKIVFIDPILNQKTRTIRVRINVPNEDMRLKPEMFVRAVIYAKMGQSGGLFVPELIGKWMCPMHPEEISDKRGSCDICGMDLESTESLGYVTQEATVTDAPIVIPASAALITGTRAVVYVAVPGKPGTYQGRQIVLGPRAGDFYTVVSGLEEGERVVMNGAFKIDSELQIQAKSSMMYAAEAPEPTTELERFQADPNVTASAKPMLESFFNVSKALSEDSLEDMKAGVRQMDTRFKAIDKKKLAAKPLFFWENLEKVILPLLAEITRTSDIELARNHYSKLEKKMFQLIQQFDLIKDETVVRFHCPMAFDSKGANWIQKGTQPANPYFGSAMLTCFDTKDILSGSEENDMDQSGPEKVKVALPETYQSALSQLFNQYFKIQSALADDNEKEAGVQITQMQGTFKNLDMALLSTESHMPWMKWEGTFKAILKDAKGVQEISSLRKKFESLSSALFDAASQFQMADSESIYRFHCPMAFESKGADWLQNHKTTKNPYYGKSMLNCGSLTETVVGGDQ